MPSLAELTDYYPQQDSSDTLPVESVVPDADGVRRVLISKPAPAPDGMDYNQEPLGGGFNTSVGNVADKVIGKLTGTNGEERYQLWPEKVIREGLAAAHDVATGQTPDYEIDPSTYDVHTSPQMIQSAQAISALAGTGGLAGADGTLGSTPFLRPALKYEGKIYKAPKTLSEGGEHGDAIPAHLDELFRQQAMSGEDISNFNFGFINHKGQFLDREKALDYGINEGLIDPSAGKFGALTSTMMADSSKPGTAIEAMAKTGSPFYSALEHNVNAIQQGKMTGDQWLGTLSNKPGVKPEELDWTGVKDFLQSKGKEPVTKAELQEHLQNNKVEIKDVDKGGERPTTHTVTSAGTGAGALSAPIAKFNSRAEAEAELARREINYPNAYHSYSELPTAESNTKYHSYQLPGGENYREKLLTLPKKSGPEGVRAKEITNKLEQIQDEFNNLYTKPDNEMSASERLARGGKARELAEEKSKLQNERRDLIRNAADENGKFDTKNNYKSSHWDEPNILAHVRMNDRMIDGKKALHIEEIQSDWHQQGRDRGYSDPIAQKRNADLVKYSNDNLEKELTDKGVDYKVIGNIKAQLKSAADSQNRNDIKTLTEQAERLYGVGQLADTYAHALLQRKVLLDSTIPDAPFKKTWHELALKRMIREAAEKGYDRLSWTPGEAQAARYDLSKQIDILKYNPDTHHVIAFDKNGQQVLSKLNVEPKDLPEVVGKEVADKLMKAEVKDKLIGGTYKVLNNADLKIGGEGMKGFYDQIVPKALEKISGEKVKTAGLGTENKSGKVVPFEHGEGFRIQYANGSSKVYKTKSEAEAKLASENVGPKVHYIDIPQSLKDKAMSKGFPLFSSTHMFTPIQGDPFKSDKSK